MYERSKPYVECSSFHITLHKFILQRSCCGNTRRPTHCSCTQDTSSPLVSTVLPFREIVCITQVIEQISTWEPPFLQNSIRKDLISLESPFRCYSSREHSLIIALPRGEGFAPCNRFCRKGTSQKHLVCSRESSLRLFTNRNSHRASYWGSGSHRK